MHYKSLYKKKVENKGEMDPAYFDSRPLRDSYNN